MHISKMLDRMHRHEVKIRNDSRFDVAFIDLTIGADEISLCGRTSEVEQFLGAIEDAIRSYRSFAAQAVTA